MDAQLTLAELFPGMAERRRAIELLPVTGIRGAEGNSASYTRFSQGERLARLGEEHAGVCLSLCLSWFRDRPDFEARDTAAQLASLADRLKDIKKRQERYTAEQAEIRRLSETLGALLPAIRAGDQAARGQVGEIQAKIRAKIVDLDGVNTSAILLEFAREHGVTLTGARSGEINHGQESTFTLLADTLSKGKYWLLSLDNSHAIGTYVSHRDFILCFDPNFGEFKVEADRVAPFFGHLLRGPYSAYQRYILYTVSM